MRARKNRVHLGTRRSASAAVLLCALLAGCGHATPPPGGTARGPQDQPRGTAASGLTAGLVLPLEAFMLNAPEERVLGRAQYLLEQQCMAGLGVPFSLPSDGVADDPTYDDADMPRRYGVTDPATAARWGYHLPGVPATRPPDRTPQALTAVQEMLLGGAPGPGRRPPRTWQGHPVPQGGCAGAARRTLGVDRVDTYLPAHLDVDSFDRAQRQPRVQQAIRTWSACMSAHGMAFQDPLQPGRNALGQAAPSPTEIDTALTDIACKRKSAVVRTWFDAEVAVQRAQITANQAALNGIRGAIDAAVRNANTVLSRHG